MVRDGRVGSYLIQVSSDSGHSSRVKKCLDSVEVLDWIDTGNRMSVWTFGLRGKKGVRKLWTLRQTRILREDYSDEKLIELHKVIENRKDAEAYD